MRTRDLGCKLPCISQTRLAPVPVRAPSALLQQQRGRFRDCQPYLSRCPVSAILKDGVVTSASSTHLHEVRDARDAPPFGPRGMLLMGFSKEHGDAARQWMQQMEPGFRVLHCTAAALDGTVEEAVAGTGLEQNGAEEHQQVNDVLPRLVLLSGMSGEEAVAIAENWEEYTGTASPIFSTLVDKLLRKSIRTAILEIVKAHVSSKQGKDGKVDTAALRQMIRRKIREKQRAGAYLVTEDEGHDASIAMQRPIGVSSEPSHHSQGSERERRCVDMENVKACADDVATHLHAKQQQMQVAYAKRLLESASPPKARSNEGERRRKESKKKVVRKGFG